ncbi:MAG: class I SAM-dependent methyltransferase [Dehalococcoidia bacterium]
MAVYDALAAEYEHGMARVTGLHAADLTDALAPRPSARVLELAAGTGAMTDQLADRVGADGLIVAADISEGMLAFARQRLANRPNVRYILGAGESLPFADGAFDAVACAFGIQHMADAGLALRSMRRVLRPEGSCAIVVWDVVGRDIKTPINEAFAAFTVSQSLSPVQEHWAGAGVLAGRLEAAGFCRVSVRSSTGWLLVSDLDEWWQAVTSGRLGDRLRAAGGEQAERLREDAYRRAEQFAVRDAGGWRFPSAALIGIGVAL